MSPIDYTKRSSAPTPPGGPSPSGRVDLSKISLTKRGERVDLTKGAGGDVRVNLNWNQGTAQPQKRGLFKKSSGGIDLDLGCLWEMADGSKGAVQALGDSFGDLTGPPWIHLQGDDRTGRAVGGENMTISGRPGQPFKRILVYSFIYEGAPNWATADGVVTLTPPGGAPVEVRMDEPSGLGMCAIALLEAAGNGGLSVSREVRYFQGHRAMDQEYGWGMRWSAGSK